ncbi:metallophosphoesterase family protein [Longimicrobium sp.]|jgi:hypothetical protein|uniref:metallophosphoesterase family protein n=1 Tax=Longimicrobium sp. TaxID=2029185 RepID=UPI002EDB3E76
MKSLSLLHLGDVHYPETRHGAAVIDDKDPGFSAALKARVSPHRLTAVMATIRRLAENQADLGGVLLSGDLTTNAKVGEYKECIQYLQKCFGGLQPWESDGLHVVPGNHDVNRSKIPLPGSDDEPDPVPHADSLEKFEEFRTAWAEIGRPILAVDAVRVTELNASGCRLPVISLNSCLGCGEYRRLPARFQKAYISLLSETKTGRADHRDLVEQLDTPAFDDTHLADIASTLSGIPSSVPAVVLAHHGLLPQAVPRVAPYSEVINAGIARYRFAGCNKPIIYCHGHIHESAVEILSHPEGGRRPLVTVSAPVLDAGFNLISFYFTDTGLVLGCEVTRYVFQNYGDVTPMEPIRIPLGDRDEPEYASDALSVRIGKVLSRKATRFHALFAAVKSQSADVEETVEEAGLANASPAEDEVVERLREMEWLGVVEITARVQAHKHWILRRRLV